MREIRTSWTPRGLSRRTTTDLDAGEVSQVGGDRTVSHVAGVASEPRRSRRASRVLPLVTSWGSKDASSSQARGSPPPPPERSAPSGRPAVTNVAARLTPTETLP